MKRRFAVCAALIWVDLAHPVFALDCDSLVENDATNIKVTENHFANGRYDSFILEINRESNLTPEEINEMREAFYGTFPDGFTQCRHILYDEMSDVTSRRVIEFISESGIRVYLLLLTVQGLDGAKEERDILKVVVTTDFTELYREWH